MSDTQSPSTRNAAYAVLDRIHGKRWRTEEEEMEPQIMIIGEAIAQARRDALTEAASIADGYSNKWWREAAYDNFLDVMSCGADEIHAAITALIDAPSKERA